MPAIPGLSRAQAAKLFAAVDGVARTMLPNGSSKKFILDWGKASADGYLSHFRAEAGSASYLSAWGLDQGSAGAILISAKNAGPGVWIASNPSHSGSPLRIQSYSKAGVPPVHIELFEGSAPVRIQAMRGAGYADGVANGTTTFTSAGAGFSAGDVGKTLTQLTSRGEGFLIPDGTTIVSVTNATTVVLSAAATGSGSGINFAVGNRPPSDGTVLFELVNNDGLAVARIRNKQADDWYKPMQFVAALGSNQHTTRQSFDGARFYRWSSSVYNANAILASSTGTLQFIGYNDTATVGAEASPATVIEFKKNALGFFGATPVAKQVLAVAATDAATAQTLANSLRTALINLGLAA